MYSALQVHVVFRPGPLPLLPHRLPVRAQAHTTHRRCSRATGRRTPRAVQAPRLYGIFGALTTNAPGMTAPVTSSFGRLMSCSPSEPPAGCSVAVLFVRHRAHAGVQTGRAHSKDTCPNSSAKEPAHGHHAAHTPVYPAPFTRKACWVWQAVRTASVQHRRPPRTQRGPLRPRPRP